LTGGVEVIPRLRLGGGLVYFYTTEYLKQGIQPDPGAYAELDAKGGAVSYDLSGEWTPLADLPLTFAVDYKHKGRQELKGDAHFNVSPALFAADPRLVDQGVTHVLTYPNLLHLGAAYRVTKPLLVAFDYTLARYRVYGEDLFAGSTLEIAVPRNYRNGYTFRLGAEYEATDRLTVRAGALRDISGLRSETYSPTLPDSSAWVGSLGAGWKISPQLSVDAGIFWAFLDKVTATGPVAFPGSYDTKVFIGSVGVSWHPAVAAR
jgi:long-chain fatty acid transport protein